MLRKILAIIGVVLPVLAASAAGPVLKFASDELKAGPDGVVQVESGPLPLRVETPGARRAWVYYEPEAGEVRKYFLGTPPEQEFTFAFPAEQGTGGRMFVAAEDASGQIAYSEPLRIASGSYRAVQQVQRPDPRLRIEVNLPAFELSVYRGNELLRRFRVGIGVKEWPAPPGLRLAKEIVWNPRWAPPNSPWATPGLVRQLQARGEVLGKMKIPLGGEILIHGTSKPRDLGRAVSHGCLRMLNRDIYQLAKMLIAETGAAADPRRLRRAEQSRYSYRVGLPQPVLVVIRYEPVVLRDAKVVQYKDVYGWTSDLPSRLATARAYAEPEPPKPLKVKPARKATRSRRKR